MIQKNKKRKIITYGIIFIVILYGALIWNIQANATDEETIVLETGSNGNDIQKALNRNSTDQHIHLTVKVPAGEYILDKTLFIYSNTTLEADKDAIFILKSDKYKVMLSSYNYQYDKGGYDQIKQVKVIGGQWNGNNTSGEMMRFIHGSDIVVSGVTIYNVGNNSHMITFAGVKDGVIEQCQLYGYNGTSAKEAIHLDVVHNKKWVPGTVTYDDTANQDIVIKNNTIKDYTRAVGSHSFVKGVYHKNIVITDNVFEEIGEEAINLYGYKDSKIERNKMKNVGTGIRLYTLLENGKQYEPLKGTKTEELPTSYGITVGENKITDAKKYGIQLYGAKEQPLVGVTIVKNHVDQTGDNGIMLYRYSKNNLIKGNQIERSGKQGIGIYLGSSYNKVIQNKIEQASSHGIYIGQSKGNLVKKNQIVKSEKHGIWLDASSHKTKVVENRISNPKEIGIGIKSSNQSMITNNTVIGAKKFGVYAVDCKQVTVKDNRYQNIGGKEEKIVKKRSS